MARDATTYRRTSLLSATVLLTAALIIGGDAASDGRRPGHPSTLSLRSTVAMKATPPAIPSAATDAFPRFTYLPPGGHVASVAYPLSNTVVTISLPVEPQLVPNPFGAASGSVSHLPSIQVAEIPGGGILAPGADAYFASATGTLGGMHAEWSWPRNGYGPYRVDVTDGRHTWTLTTDNLTNSATVSIDELKKVAAGVRT